MLFLKLKDGRNQNLLHISLIDVDDTDVVYYSARGSLNGYREHFDTNAEALARFAELQVNLMV